MIEASGFRFVIRLATPKKLFTLVSFAEELSAVSIKQIWKTYVPFADTVFTNSCICATILIAKKRRRKRETGR